jgi:hypothetical protein
VRKLIPAVFLLLCCSLAHAQNKPEWEIFGGYSFVRVSAGNDITIPAFSLGSVPTSDYVISLHQNGNGWHGQLVQDVNGWVGGVIDFSGFYANRTFDLTPFLLNEQLRTNLSAYTFLAGPRFVHRGPGPLSLFGEPMVGLANGRANVASLATVLATVAPNVEAVLGLPFHETKWAYSLGGGIDLRVRPSLAVRLVEAEWIRTHFPQTISRDFQNNVRVSAGIVLRVGGTR